jgi:hypothetical protein
MRKGITEVPKGSTSLIHLITLANSQTKMAAHCDSELLDFPSLLETVKALNAEQLVDVVSTASVALKKFVKSMGARKVNSANPAGVMPAALMKNGAWVECVLARAQQEGWDAFVVQTKSKKTGTVVAEQMSESVLNEGNGLHVFGDTGKAFTRKHAMVYGKVLKDGGSDWYSDFERSYVSDSPVAPKLAKAAASVVPKSSAEVAEEALQKKAMAAEKRKAVAQAKKAEKAEEAAKAAATALPAGTVRVVRVQTPPPAARAVAAVSPVMVATVATPMASIPKASAPAAPRKPAPKKAVPRTEEWEAEFGVCKKWMFEGKTYMRSWMDSMYVYIPTEDGYGTEGDYLGLFRNGKIHDTPDVHGVVEVDMDEEDVVEEDDVDE